MYKKNRRSEQPLLLSDVNGLPERSLKYLRGSWAESFRQEIFLRIPEDRFALLYDSDPSRPNVPVNVLIGLEVLKEWHGWSDEELYEHFLFDLQVRYAVGCDNLGEGDFDLRSLYNFRKRISEYALRTGENLMKVVFERITDEQVKELKIDTRVQRMDSTQILSNIADQSRLELLVEALQRFYRILSAEDRGRYAEVFGPYIQESAGQYTYRIKGREAVWQRIEEMGIVLADLLEKLVQYAGEPVYQTVKRFFDENFKRVEAQMKAKANQEITPGCLQSFDDLEATYRVKGNRSYKGFVANLSETCAPENPLQLITSVQLETNRTSDIALLEDGLPELQERTGVEKMVTDGGYVSPDVDASMRKQGIEQITTGLTGTLPDHQNGKKALSDFEMRLDKEGNVQQVTCPAGQTPAIRQSTSGVSFMFIFPTTTCEACALYQAGQCPVQFNRRKKHFCLTVPKERAISSQRRRRFEQCKEEARSLRPAIEATIFQVKHALKAGKVRVRGLFRTTCVVLCASLAVNLRRIHRFEHGRQRGRYTLNSARNVVARSFLSLFQTGLKPSPLALLHFCTIFNC